MKLAKALLLLALLIVPLAGMAQWSTDPAVNTPICNAAGDQLMPGIVTDDSGGAIMAWPDHRSGNDDIYAQRIGADGVVRWTADGAPISVATGDQQYPTMVSDGAGGAIITWQDFRGGDYDIYAQHISSGGVVQWTADGLPICTALGEQTVPTIASDGAGGAIITWQDARAPGYNIYAQRVDASGTIRWIANGVPACAALGYRIRPTIAVDGAGGAIITWQNSETIWYDIYAQRVDANGAVQWSTNGVEVCGAALDQEYPTIVPDDSGGAIITWQDLRGGIYNNIYAQRIDAGGTTRWPDNGVEVCGAGGGQTYPYVISDGAGGGIITWKDGRQVFQMDIYAQRIDAGGTPRWHDNGERICTASDDQTQPSLAPDGAGGAVIAWRDRRGEHSDVYAQRINDTGAVQWALNGVPVSTAGDGQIQPAVVSAGAGRVIVAWEDHRSGAPDIYAQLVDQGGLLAHQDPAYQVSYRSATYTDWSTARDSKLKQKAEKRQNYKGEAWFTINPADADSALNSGVYLEFASGLYTLEVSAPGAAVPPITTDAKVKKFRYDFTTPVAKTDPVITVHVTAKITKPLVMKKYWWVPKNLPAPIIDPARYKDPVPPLLPTVTSRLWLRMPNFNNVGEEAFGMTGLTNQFPTGLLVGVPQGIKQANAVNHPKYSDVMKSLTKKVSAGYVYHTATNKCLCTFDGVRPRLISTLQKSLPPAKQNNVLFGDLLALRLNIAASNLGAFQGNFGNLVYGMYGSEFEGQTLSAIAARADSMLSSCATLPGADALASLQTVLENINSAFSGVFDTASFGTRTVVKPVRNLEDVWYLLPPPAGTIPPQAQPAPAVPTTLVPAEYALEQNYPNPFNPTTTIQFTLADPCRVTLTVYNFLGQEVATLINNELLDDGDQEAEFDAGSLASGVYFYRLVATPQVDADEDGAPVSVQRQPFTEVKKMMLMK